MAMKFFYPFAIVTILTFLSAPQASADSGARNKSQPVSRSGGSQMMLKVPAIKKSDELKQSDSTDPKVRARMSEPHQNDSQLSSEVDSNRTDVESKSADPE